jgi:BMFP domain-containing protein YqiC
MKDILVWEPDMESRSRLFEDLAKIAGSAAGSLSGLKDEIETRARQRLEDVAARLDLVTREDFDAVLAVAIKAREEQERLERRMTELEAQMARLQAAYRPKF